MPTTQVSETIKLRLKLSSILVVTRRLLLVEVYYSRSSEQEIFGREKKRVKMINI